MPALPSAVVVLSSSLCRLVYDRETGKPKGYGFCEYQDQETALSAMRNLNGREFSGRALRVDNAASEKNKEELKSESEFCGGEHTAHLRWAWPFQCYKACLFCEAGKVETSRS